MLRLISCTFCALFISFFTIAQDNSILEKKDLVAGSVTLDDGSELNGYLKKFGSITIKGDKVPARWIIQNRVSFLSEKNYSENEFYTDEMFVKFNPEDLKSMVYDGDDYETIIFMEALEYGNVQKQLENAVCLAKRVEDGKIKVYEYYHNPSLTEMVQVAGGDEIDLATPIMIWRTADMSKCKPVERINLSKRLSDCPAVVEKVKKNRYIPKTDGKKPPSKFLLKTLYREEVALMAIRDFNQCE